MVVSLRTRMLVVLAALAPLVGAGCGGLTDSYDYAEVTVSVADQRGRPLGEVPLTLFTSRRVVEYASTDAQGRYTFRFVPFGEFGVAATPPAGYSTDYLASRGGDVVEDGLLIGEGDRMEVPLTITKICCATIVVRVQELSGEPISGVRVTGYSQDYNSSRTTSPEGFVRFEALPAANYGVVVDIPPGYALAPGRRNYVDGILPAIEEETNVTLVLVRG